MSKSSYVGQFVVVSFKFSVFFGQLQRNLFLRRRSSTCSIGRHLLREASPWKTSLLDHGMITVLKNQSSITKKYYLEFKFICKDSKVLVACQVFHKIAF